MRSRHPRLCACVYNQTLITPPWQLKHIGQLPLSIHRLICLSMSIPVSNIYVYVNIYNYVCQNQNPYQCSYLSVYRSIFRSIYLTLSKCLSPYVSINLATSPSTKHWLSMSIALSIDLHVNASLYTYLVCLFVFPYAPHSVHEDKSDNSMWRMWIAKQILANQHRDQTSVNRLSAFW